MQLAITSMLSLVNRAKLSFEEMLYVLRLALNTKHPPSTWLFQEFKCPYSEDCEINSVSRRFCQKCRLRKCFTVGMKKEWILNEEQLRRRKNSRLNNTTSVNKRSQHMPHQASQPQTPTQQPHQSPVPHQGVAVYVSSCRNLNGSELQVLKVIHSESELRSQKFKANHRAVFMFFVPATTTTNTTSVDHKSAGQSGRRTWISLNNSLFCFQMMHQMQARPNMMPQLISPPGAQQVSQKGHEPHLECHTDKKWSWYLSEIFFGFAEKWNTKNSAEAKAKPVGHETPIVFCQHTPEKFCGRIRDYEFFSSHVLDLRGR